MKTEIIDFVGARAILQEIGDALDPSLFFEQAEGSELHELFTLTRIQLKAVDAQLVAALLSQEKMQADIDFLRQRSRIGAGSQIPALLRAPESTTDSPSAVHVWAGNCLCASCIKLDQEASQLLGGKTRLIG